MFDALSDKFEGLFQRIRGEARLTEDNMRDAVREVRMALLEADVNFKVVKDSPPPCARRPWAPKCCARSGPARCSSRSFTTSWWP